MNPHARLIALVVARTKLEAASRLAKEATVDFVAWVPVEVREEMQKIAAEIDTFVRRRLEIIP